MSTIHLDRGVLMNRGDPAPVEKSEVGFTSTTVSLSFSPSSDNLTDLLEANKLRTFFRILFAVAALTLGLDGLTVAKKVNTTR